MLNNKHLIFPRKYIFLDLANLFSTEEGSLSIAGVGTEEKYVKTWCKPIRYFSFSQPSACIM